MTIIYTYAHSLITKARQAGRYSTADIYTSTLNKLFEFVFTGYETTAKRANFCFLLSFAEYTKRDFT